MQVVLEFWFFFDFDLWEEFVGVLYQCLVMYGVEIKVVVVEFGCVGNVQLVVEM